MKSKIAPEAATSKGKQKIYHSVILTQKGEKEMEKREKLMEEIIKAKLFLLLNQQEEAAKAEIEACNESVRSVAEFINPCEMLEAPFLASALIFVGKTMRKAIGEDGTKASLEAERIMKECWKVKGKENV